MSEEIINEKQKQQIIDLLKVIIDSRFQVTHHREISTWAAIIFYLGGLFSVSKYLIENPTTNTTNIILVIIALLLVCFTLLVFVHSQYGAHVASRYTYGVCVKKLFELINNDIELTKDNSKIDKNIAGESYPRFIQEEINLCNSREHKICKVWPGVIYIFLFHKIFSFICQLLCFKIKEKEYPKIQLIESSLYNLIIIPTVLFVYLVIKTCK